MFRTFAATSLLALACAMPLQQATAQDAVGGAIFGGAAGAILGGAIGGRGGCGCRRDHRRHHRRGDRVRRPAPPRGLLLVSQRLLHAASGRRLVVVAPQYCGGPAMRRRPPPTVPPPAYGRAGYGAGTVRSRVDDDEPVVAAPRPRAASADAIAACARKYRSYDPRSGTFLSLDGTRKPCP
jgi:hypothetical protein